MKKILTTALFISCLSFAQAQQSKPTKEQTIAFIERTINELKGIDLPYAKGVVNKVVFTGDKLIYYTSRITGGTRLFDLINEAEDLRWDLLKNIEFSLGQTDKPPYYYITFTSNFKHTTKFENEINNKPTKITNDLISSLEIFIPANKAESIKKEENKDPFTN